MQNTLVGIPIVFGDDRPWPSRSNLTCKSNLTPFWVCPHHNSSVLHARITKYGLKMHLSTVKFPTNFGLDWFWSSLSFAILKPVFLPNLFAFFLYYIQWDPSFVNISKTIVGDRSNQFGPLTEHKFCHKLSRSISIDSHFCNRFIIRPSWDGTYYGMALSVQLLARKNIEWPVRFFSCDQAALWMVQSVCSSVRLSVCHTFLTVPIIVSSWNFQELLPVTEVTSMQKVKVRGQRSRSQRSQPNFTVSGM